MKAQEDLDFTTLSWVKQELDETLKQANESLEAYVEDPGDTSQLRFCATYLHQVHGTLRMVELYGAALVAEEMERVALALLEGNIAQTDDAYQVLLQGIVQLPDYLDRLASGHRDIPVVLLPLLNDLRASRGAKLLSENALFAPDLSAEVPKAEATKALDDSELKRNAVKLRSAFQFGLVKWFRDEDPQNNLKRLITVASRLKSLCSVQEARRLWWAAEGVLEAILVNGLEPNAALKLLCGRIDRQIKRLVDEGEGSFRRSPPDELTKSLLYYAAHANATSPRVTALKRAYRLDQYLPKEEEIEHARGSLTGHNRELLGTVSEAIKDDLLRVKDSLDLYLRSAESTHEDLKPMSETLDRVADTLGMLGLGVPRRKVEEQKEALDEVATSGRDADERVLMSIAGALLYVESSLDDYIAQLGAPGAAQAEAPEEDRLPQSEVARVHEATVREAIVNLQEAKKAIVAFIETPWDHAQIADTPRLWAEVVGVLRIMGLEEPAALVRGIQQYVEIELLERREVPEGEQLDTLADAIASMEYYLEAVRDQRPAREDVLKVARRSIEALGYPREDLGVPSDKGGAQPAAAPAQEPKAEPSPESETDTAGAPAADSTQAPDSTLADSTLAESTQAFESAPAEEPAPDEAPEAAPDSLAAEQPAETEAAEASPPEGAFAFADEIDDDIRDVFVEELEEELGNIRSLYPQWRADQEDEESLVTMRRSFHTLKGSGRLVGATVVGEFSWKVENLLNRVIDQTITAGPEVFKVMDRVLEAMPEMLEHLKDGPPPSTDLSAIMDACDRLAEGGAVAFPGGDDEPPDGPGPGGSAPPPSPGDSDQGDGGPGDGDSGAGPEAGGAAVEGSSPEADVDVATDIGASEASPAADDAAVQPGSTKQEPDATQARDDDDFDLASLGLDESDLAPHQPDTGSSQSGGRGELELDELDLDSFDWSELEAGADEGSGSEGQTTEEESGWDLSAFDLDDPADEGGASESETAGQDTAQQDAHASWLAPAPDADTVGDELAAAVESQPGATEETHAGAPAPSDSAGEAEDTVAGETLADFEFEFDSDFGSEGTEAQVPEDVEFDPDAEAATTGAEAGVADDGDSADAEASELADGVPVEPIDPVLYDIFTKEADTHLTSIKAYLDEARSAPGDAPVPQAMVRSAHTLNGAAAMAEVPSIAAITGPAEGYLKRLNAAGTGLPDEGIAALDDSVVTIETILAELGKERPVVPHVDELVSHLEALRDALPPPSPESTPAGASPAPEGVLDEEQLASAFAEEIAAESHPAEGAGEGTVEQGEADGAAEVEWPAAPEPDTEPQPPAAAEAETGPSEGAPSDDFDDELLGIFLEEGLEILDNADGIMQQWRDSPEAAEPVAGLQRELHTLKGGARMAGIDSVAELSHAMENVFEALAEQRLSVNENAWELIERAFDRLHELMSEVRERRPTQVPRQAVARLEALLRGEPSPGEDSEAQPAGDGEAQTGAAEPAGDGSDAGAVSEAGASTPEQAATQPAAEGKPDAPAQPTRTQPQEPPPQPRTQQEAVRVRADLLDDLVNYAGEVSIYRARLEQQVSTFRFNLVEFDQTVSRLREQLRQLEGETEAQILARYQRESDEHDEDFDPLEMDRYSQLQQLSRALAESVSDLVSIQELLDDLSRESETLLLQQSRVTSDLQEGLMKTRMVPFASLMPRLRRILRQTSDELGTRAQLHVEGAEGEMDRTVLDRITAPLEHMLRNALAHGLESPEERRAAGKPEEGQIRLHIGREASEVVIEVSDDGRGIDRDAVRRKAIEAGLLKEDVELSDQEILGFILETGFSTAGEVSQLAGRGIGMDVVHSEIKQLSGTLDIDSELGRGTTFTIRLPFTLAVTQAIMIKVGEETYAVPLSSIDGVVRMERPEFERRLLSQDTAYEYLNESYYLQDLSVLLGAEGFHATEQPGMVPLLMVRSGDRRAALRVDRLLGSREVVVKSVGPQISSVPGIFGATVLGDGSVVLILDLGPLLRRGAALELQREAIAGEPGEEVAAAPEPERAPEHEAAEQAEESPPTAMVVDDSITMRKVMSRMLERHDFEVITAKDGVDAVAQLHEQVPDVMLLDIEMPRMDGYELATHVRNDQRLNDVGIIMITSRTGEKHKQRAMDLGVDRYMGKPYQEADLLKNIRELLDKDGETA